MKKLILSLFLSIIGFIGFSNAYVEGPVNIATCNGYDCSSTKVNFDNSIGIIGKSNSNGCNRLELLKNGDSIMVTINGNIGQLQNLNLEGLVYVFARCGSAGGQIDFTLAYPDPPVVEGGSSNITPVIVGLFGVYGELIPYVVYIGIGILIVTVGFYAIRRLVNWLSDKIHNNFKF